MVFFWDVHITISAKLSKFYTFIIFPLIITVLQSGVIMFGPSVLSPSFEKWFRLKLLQDPFRPKYLYHSCHVQLCTCTENFFESNLNFKGQSQYSNSACWDCTWHEGDNYSWGKGSWGNFMYVFIPDGVNWSKLREKLLINIVYRKPVNKWLLEHNYCQVQEVRTERSEATITASLLTVCGTIVKSTRKAIRSISSTNDHTNHTFQWFIQGK